MILSSLLNFGILTCVSHSVLAFLSLFLATVHGNCRGRLPFSQLVGNCGKGLKRLIWTRGIFCANFSSKRGNYLPCFQAWCGSCYTSDPSVTFQVHSLFADIKANESEKARLETTWGDRHRRKDEYLVGRNGDDLLIPFECDTCVFRKLRGHDPDTGNNMDTLLLACIRHMHLNAFLSNSSHTFKANAQKIDCA